MFRESFTLMEFIIVIVVVSILTTSISPYLERNPMREVLNQVKRHVMLTQHMAMVNDVYDAKKSKWFKAMWRISFRTKNCYVVSSNIDLDTNYDREESAFDSMSKTLLYSNNKCELESTDNKSMFLYEEFNIDKIEFSNACGSNRFIAFDNLGRPHKTLIKLNDYLKSDCIITFYSQTQKGEIKIRPETGYVTSKVIK